MLGKLTAGAIAAALLGGPAYATDFTFDVPVSVHNVPLLTQIEVSCLVSVLPAGTSGAAGNPNVIGLNSVVVDAPGGSYDGTVTVPVENSGVLRSVDARSYSCSMIGRGQSPSGASIELNGSWSTSLQRMTGTGLVSETLWTEGNFH